jgi:hypothetical protein
MWPYKKDEKRNRHDNQRTKLREHQFAGVPRCRGCIFVFGAHSSPGMSRAARPMQGHDGNSERRY